MAVIKHEQNKKYVLFKSYYSAPDIGVVSMGMASLIVPLFGNGCSFTNFFILLYNIIIYVQCVNLRCPETSRALQDDQNESYSN